jgi:hypothetical protein
MNDSLAFYLCPTCFYASKTPDDFHEHALLCVDPGLPGDEKRNPIKDHTGRILFAAPRWFYEAIIEARKAMKSANLGPNLKNKFT